MKLALYPGTFDPLTNGHLALIRRGLAVFDQIVVAVADNTPKFPLFSQEERVAMAREAVGDDDRILVEPFTGLTVEYAAKRGACAILRGLRAVSDFEYEFQLALMNRRLQRDIQTVFLMTDYQWLFISSTIVKAAASHGADIVGLVPENVCLRLMEKYQCVRPPPASPPPTAASASTNKMAAPLPVICLAGPTGCGKTAAALTLAEALDGEVINADSRQVYSDFPLITAQPSPEEQACCPHHLYGFLPTEQKISAGRWADQAVAEAKAVLARGHVPLLVGGTGLYFQGLLHGIAEIPAIDPAITAALTARLAEEGPAALHAELAAKDPAYAARIHPNDRQRIVRALEVLAGTGHTFSWWHEHGMPEPPCAGPLP